MVDEQRPCCQCGEQRREIDFRLVGATNRDLKQLVRSGEFRRQEMLVQACPMIRRIQARNYCCLRYVDVSLDRFHVLVGPNASGKSTLLDIVAFLGDMVSGGLEAAVEKRTRNFQDLVWRRPAKQLGFELAVEFDIPGDVKAQLPKEKGFELFRYEVAIREDGDGIRIDSERGLLMPCEDDCPRQEVLEFPAPLDGPETILLGGGRPGARTILSKSREARDNFNVEVSEKAGKGWAISISFGPDRSTLGNLPESPDRFPVSTRVKRLLENGLQRLFLDSARMRQPSPPTRRREVFAPDGSNLPRVIRQLREENENVFEDWLAHVRTALPEIDDIRVVEREDDRHCYLMLRYGTGVEVPSWQVSDGTLRLLALTLPAYLKDPGKVYLMEEPENGLHPGVMQDVYDALSSVYDSQVLLATHSPIFLSHADLEHVLCFAKDDEGATDVIPARAHPGLRDWQGDPNLSVFFAAGVLSESRR